MALFAHAGGIDEMLYVFAPALIFFLVYRLARGKQKPPDAEDPGAPGADPAHPPSPR